MLMNIVEVELKEYHYRFLCHIFQCRKDLKIHRDHEIGRFIFAHISYSDYPLKRKKKENPVSIEIPKTLNGLNRKFPYISPENNIKISDYIESYFTLYFREFIFTCRKFNIQYKDAYNMFIEAHDIGHDAINFERLKKNDYRFREKMKDFIVLGIQRAFSHELRK